MTKNENIPKKYRCPGCGKDLRIVGAYSVQDVPTRYDMKFNKGFKIWEFGGNSETLDGNGDAMYFCAACDGELDGRNVDF